LTYSYEKVRDRNEALDCRVYARAALNLVGVDVDKMANAGVCYTRNPAKRVQRFGTRVLNGGVKL
jgi:phage terminase large subunit GpA-like protein